jgi:hypothetical protein|mmetsp:Transcript_26111/g.67303  ORF Transcript_26111/g.67303 Transcript_26111/m.67303 type:complete len:122 (+) Transcript_26111:86-451(+)
MIKDSLSKLFEKEKCRSQVLPTQEDSTIVTMDSVEVQKNQDNEDKGRSKRGGKRSNSKRLGNLLEELNASSGSELDFDFDVPRDSATCVQTVDSREVATGRGRAKVTGNRPKRRPRTTVSP